MTFRHCTEVTLECPIEATVYGYAPNLGGNAFLAAVFALCFLFQLGLGVYYRAFSFGIALSLGCLMECLGYVGRLQMHANPWSEAGFQQQIVCLILAPSLLAAGVYLSLKHIILYLDAELSRLQPKWITWIFIGCDITSILIQAGGGALAGVAGQNNLNLLSTGNTIMLIGIAFQVGTMAVCGLLAIDFAVRYYLAAKTRPKQENGSRSHSVVPVVTRFKVFFVAEVICYVTILSRCIYRLPEMAGGWGNPLMRDEVEFMILDGCMIAIAAITFTICHPGMFFPLMVGRKTGTKYTKEDLPQSNEISAT